MLFGLLALISCRTINAALCKAGVFPVCGSSFNSYNSTFLPNLLGQWSLSEIEVTSSIFYPLKAVECSKYLELFLCSVLSPACVNETPEGVLPYLIPIPPCRSLCQKVLSECESTIEEFGINLPSAFNCNNFPVQHDDDNHPCIPIQSHHEPLPSGTLRWRKTQPIIKKNTSTLTVENQCPHDLISTNSDDVFAGITHCNRPCKPIESDDSQTSVFRLMLAVFSVVSAIITSFSIIIFLRDRKRFVYPERPTLYFSLCYLVISLMVMAGLIAPEQIACNADKLSSGLSDLDPGLVNGVESTKCTIVFGIVYFFANAALSWWLILILIWGLSVLFEWNLDMIEQKGGYFHIFAWSTPTILTILAIYKEKIHGDATLGICTLDDSTESLYWFSILPVLTMTTIGIVVFILGLQRLVHMKRTFVINFESQARLEQFVFRISSFSIAFLLPQINSLIIKMYESRMRSKWEETWYHDNCQDLNLPCPLTASPNVYIHPALLLLKYILFIIPAWAPLIWVVNGKALRGWGLNSNSSISTSNESFKTNSLDKSSISGSNDSRHDHIHFNT